MVTLAAGQGFSIPGSQFIDISLITSIDHQTHNTWLTCQTQSQDNVGVEWILLHILHYGFLVILFPKIYQQCLSQWPRRQFRVDHYKLVGGNGIKNWEKNNLPEIKNWKKKMFRQTKVTVNVHSIQQNKNVQACGVAKTNWLKTYQQKNKIEWIYIGKMMPAERVPMLPRNNSPRTMCFKN